MTRASSSLRIAFASALSVLSCGGAEIRGASVVAPGDESLAGPGVHFTPAGCRDGQGQAAAAPSLELHWQTLGDGRTVWVEARSGYDALVLENAFKRASADVWQLIVRDERGPARLHEIRRWPRQRKQTWSIADEFDEVTTAFGFQATPRRVALQCNLQRLAAAQALTGRPAAAGR
jgi:hypothetical protein